MPHFVDFMALEAMACHWDGYCGNANNYRLWLPSRGKAVFLPHGMDQLFGDTEASVLDHPTAMVANAVMQQPAYRKRYRERLRVHLPLFAPDRLQPKVAAIGQKLVAELRRSDPGAADALAEAVRSLQERIAARHVSLQAQVVLPEPKPQPLPFGSPLALKKWHPAAETEGIELEPDRLQGLAVLQARIGERGSEPRLGAFRTNVLLGPGRYELRGNVRCSDVVPPPKDGDGNEHGGVRLRAGDARSERLLGSTGWQAVTCQFEVGEFQRSVELACELHAFAGSAWFRSTRCSWCGSRADSRPQPQPDVGAQHDEIVLAAHVTALDDGAVVAGWQPALPATAALGHRRQHPLAADEQRQPRGLVLAAGRAGGDQLDRGAAPHVNGQDLARAPGRTSSTMPLGTSTPANVTAPSTSGSTAISSAGPAGTPR